MGQLKKMALLVPALLLFFFVTNDAGAVGGVEVCDTLLFGPAPETMTDTVGAYMWVIPNIQNNGYGDQMVTVSLQVTGAPLGCDQEIELILPGFDSFWVGSGEEKSVLYRVRYECHAPAYPEVFPLNIDFCVSGPFGSDCDSEAKYLVIHEPPYQFHGDSSDIETAWFTYCFNPPFGCLTPWPIDWSGVSYHKVGFLGGSPDAIYLRWFSHGVHIYDYDEPGRPFDVIPNWETRLSYLQCYGCLWYDEEELSEYTATGGCGDFLLPEEERILCSSGDVGYTYIDPEFHGHAGLWCEGLVIGSDCRGSGGIDYCYSY